MKCKVGEPGKKVSVAVESKESGKAAEIQTFDKKLIIRVLTGAAEVGQKIVKVKSSKDQCSSACSGTLSSTLSINYLF